MSWMDDDIIEEEQQGSADTPPWMLDEEVGPKGNYDWPTVKEPSSAATVADRGAWADDHPDAPAVVTEKNDPTVGDMFGGFMEAAGTFLTGATTGTLGQVGGTLKGVYDVAMDPELDFLTTDTAKAREAGEHIRQTADDWGNAVTYEPRTETGQEYVQAVGEALGPIEAVEPMIAGGGITAAGRRGANNRRGAATRAFEDPQTRVDAGDKIAYDERGVPLHVVNDAESRTAMANLGIPPEMMNQFKYASPETRKAMVDMIQRGQARMNDTDLPNARSTMGEYIGGRAQLANSALQKHGAAIDEAAKTRQGTHVLTNDVNTKYNKLLEDQRVKVNDDGTLNFEGSAIPDESRAKLQEIHKRMNQYAKDGYADFDELHKYKQYLSDIASYDKQASGGSAGVQQIVKGLRSQINDTLGANAADYKAANAGYSEIVAPMRKMLKTTKGDSDALKDIDIDRLSDSEVAEMFALQARGLTNNTKGGVELKATMKAINDAIKNNADMFTPEELRAAGLSDKGDVNVNLQKLADLAGYTDQWMPDKRGSIGVLMSDANKGAPTKSGIFEDVYQAGMNVAHGGRENRHNKNQAKIAADRARGIENLLEVIGREY